MQFSKLFEICKDDGDDENYICTEFLFDILKKYNDNEHKYNLKRSLQKFQGGSKKICGKDSATGFSVLKYLFVNASLKSCETIVKNVINHIIYWWE